MQESKVNEQKLGQAYFEILGYIKDEIANNISQFSKQNNLDVETTKRLIFIAQATVDSSGGNAFPALLKSCK
jgi:hypothetical protein